MAITLIEIFDFIGTVAFAISGAFTGIKKKMDIFGVNILAILTACGGGLIRDITIGKIPPQMFLNPFYVIVAVVVANIVFCVMYFHKELPQRVDDDLADLYDKAFFVSDSLGLAAFMVDGVMIGVHAGYEENAFLLGFLGFITGVGGGVFRDVLSNQMPAIFVKHVYALAVIVGSIFMLVVFKLFGTWNIAMVLGFSVVLLVRLLARHFLWNLPKVE